MAPDPGPDGVLNTADDGPRFMVYTLTNPGNAFLALTNPAAALVTEILAPGITDPVVSVTAPTMVAVPVDDCAPRPAAKRADESSRRRNM